MQEIINQILEGNFDYESGSLDFSCAKLELTLSKGTVYEGSFHIFSTSNRFTNGFITTNDMRMECLTPEFTGSDEEISYCFHAEHLEEGDVVKGAFCIVSNQGEYSLPFVVSIEHTVLTSSIGTIKNLFHFTNLAKSNWDEAVSLFYSPKFQCIFTGNDAQYREVYRGLSAYLGKEQNVEEFLIHINKKQKIEYIAEEEQIDMDISYGGHAYAVIEKELTIIRNGWGYTELNVSCEGDFLFTEKSVVTDNDFLGNTCRLPIYIDSSMCRTGRNFGRIYLYNSYVSLTIPVMVRVGDDTMRNHVDLSRNRTAVQLMEFYLAFRMKKISTTTWLNETGKLVERLVALDEKNVSARLFQAQLLMTEERYNEAGWLLDHAADLMENSNKHDTLWAYYLYLTTLMHRDAEYVDRVTEEVKQIYRMEPDNWRVAWLLLYLSEEYNKSASGKWLFLEKQFSYGCTSPVLYIEALLLLNSNPSLLRKADEFEQQVLWFGARQETLGEEAQEQLLYLCSKLREYSPVVLKTLIKLYENKADVRVLQEICSMLMRGGRTDNVAYSWYLEGVRAQLRITNLYEYFMMSLDLQETVELPKTVLLYFSYQNNLDYEHIAYLYDYVLQNKDKLGELYEAYYARIERFVQEQIQKEHINRHLAGLYRQFLQPEMINERTAPALSRLLFANEIYVEDARLQKVVVYQPGNLRPSEYPLVEGKTWVALYGNEYTILFEDTAGNRFTNNIEYTIEKLMIPGKNVRRVAPYIRSCLELDLYLCRDKREDEEPFEERIARQLRIADSPYVESSVKRESYLRVLQYYYDLDDMHSLDNYFSQIPAEEMTMSERGAIVRLMVLRGQYELAYTWIEQYGPYFVDAKILVRLIGPMLEQNSMAEDKTLDAAALYAFQKGKYDSTLIQYLAMNYRGMVKSMRDIWKTARSFEVECYKLTEKILIQMLYSGSFVGEKMEIFRYYVSQGARQEVEEAFLAQCAYDYFVKEKVMEDYVFQEIANMCRRGEAVQRVCKLAFLKYYAENRQEIEENVKGLLNEFLQEMVRDRIHLDFFRDFRDCEPILQELCDKTIIEYRAHPCGKATIHYVVLRENGEADEYRCEHMQEVYGGVCFKEFVLFFGESLQYYITEERNGEEQLTESGTLQKSDISHGTDDSKYQLINDIVISKTLQDYDTLDNLLDEYYRKEYWNSELFEIM